jgi:hypothetical protein
MNAVHEQLELLKQYYPSVSVEKLPDASALVTISNFTLPPGWSKPSANIKFVVPVGYPLAKPDCFWADADLRLHNGGLPANTNVSPIPQTAQAQLWFSWHAGQWYPNRDNLLTYIRVIETRLKQLR